MLSPKLIRESSGFAARPRAVATGRKAAVLLLGAGITCCTLAWTQPTDGDLEAAPPTPATSADEASRASADAHDLNQTLLDLEKELDRLETAHRRLDEQATELLGPPKDNRHRIVELPQEHAALIHYLKGCLNLVETVESSFGDLMAAEDQVDLKKRIPEARKHVDRIEESGSAGMLVRRQVRVWIEKDLSAVESLNADWPAIRTSIQQLIQTAKRFEAGDAPIEKVASSHQNVLNSATTRIRFHRSKLGILCRQTAEAANQAHQKRQATPAIVMQP